MALLTPETYSSREAEAVFKSTRHGLRSLPRHDPVLRSVSSGSCHAGTVRHQWISDRFYQLCEWVLQARAMDAALRCPTSNCGNSSVASLLAEYTEAPASFTMMYCTVSGISLRSCTIICSDSREAVPFPREINVIWYLEISFSVPLWLRPRGFAGQSDRSR